MHNKRYIAFIECMINLTSKEIEVDSKTILDPTKVL